MFHGVAKAGQRKPVAFIQLLDDSLQGAFGGGNAVARHGAGAIDEDLDGGAGALWRGNAWAKAGQHGDAFGHDAVARGDGDAVVCQLIDHQHKVPVQAGPAGQGQREDRTRRRLTEGHANGVAGRGHPGLGQGAVQAQG